jgi:hypothetical protein
LATQNALTPATRLGHTRAPVPESGLCALVLVAIGSDHSFDFFFGQHGHTVSGEGFR